MAVTITLGTLANLTRVSVTPDTSDVPPFYAAVLTSNLAAASELVEARAPNAPDESSNKAVVQIVAYWLNSPDAVPARFGYNAWLNSGAAQILAPYIERRAEAV